MLGVKLIVTIQSIMFFKTVNSVLKLRYAQPFRATRDS